MTANVVHTKELFSSLDEAWSELLTNVVSTDATIINSVPFEDSWTIAQIATHVTKSNKAIVQGLNMEGTPAERNPEEEVPNLKKTFLDFTVKFKSPEFIVPEKRDYDEAAVMDTLKKSIEQLQDIRTKVNLTAIITLPILGEVTKLELLHFVLYHTQRHIHQLKKTIKILHQKQSSKNVN
ncbi:MAG: DinB family protein [Ginsengibacter sp.]